MMIANFMKSKIGILIVLCLPIILVSCAKDKLEDNNNLVVKKIGYVHKDTIAYKWLGLPGKPKQDTMLQRMLGENKTITSDKPVVFNVSLFIEDNDGCHIFHYTKEGKEVKSIKSDSFKSYLLGDNTLLKIFCKGKLSNIDYKILAKDEDTEYSRYGSFYFYRTQNDLED
jgi:hypothetical protein